MNAATYAQLLRQARLFSRRPDEAEDLLQTVLIFALKAGRGDVTCAENRRWLRGALRKRAAHEARSALRRRAREGGFVPSPPDTVTPTPERFLQSLPPALSRTARLILSGHNRTEIRHLLRISDPALRQRLVQIRRRWCALAQPAIHETSGFSGALPYGLIRRALLPAVQRPEAHLGSHDPDGHLFVVRHAHKNPQRGNRQT